MRKELVSSRVIQHRKVTVIEGGSIFSLTFDFLIFLSLKS